MDWKEAAKCMTDEEQRESIRRYQEAEERRTVTQHSPEPWSIKGDRIFSTETVVTEPIANDSGISQADLRRIVACVNACKGIPTEAIGPLMDIIREELKHDLVGGLHNTEPFVTEWKRKAIAVLEEHGWETENYT